MKPKLPFLLTFLVWLPATFLTLVCVFVFQALRENSQIIKGQVLAQETSIEVNPNWFSQMPMSDIEEKMLRANVKDYLKKYHSPMIDVADKLVDAARKNNLDPLLLVAIAQCESNLGKKMPSECHNPFGWGIHSTGRLCFNTWEEGFEKVASGLRKQYVDKGLISPEEIMTKYNYDSWKDRDGSWAKCVVKFMNDLQPVDQPIIFNSP